MEHDLDDDLGKKIDSAWIRRNAPCAICRLGAIPIIPLPNGNRDDGDWCLGIDRKHECTTLLLYAWFGRSQQAYRRLGTIQTRRELIDVYEQLVGKGSWPANSPSLAEGTA